MLFNIIDTKGFLCLKTPYISYLDLFASFEYLVCGVLLFGNSFSAWIDY